MVLKNKKTKKVKLNKQRTKKKCRFMRYSVKDGNSKNKFTIVFFHGQNYASSKYNYTYEEDGTVRKNYFLDKLSNIANLFLYDRPEEILRFNYEEGKSNINVDYSKCSLELHVTKLHSLLLHKKLKPPYILVSHSVGSLYALKFSQKYPRETKHVFLIDPIQYTVKVAKQFYSPPLTSQNIKKYVQMIQNPESTKTKVEKSLFALDSNTYSIPYFIPKLKCPLTTFFNVDTKSNIHEKLTIPYVAELTKYNPSMYTNYYYYDRDHYLSETNPQGIITKIKRELEKDKKIDKKYR
tara:strand:- start:1519 stop:2400 length:882 start_codon:yes stop_codon:yes gene_type:complete